MPYTYDLADWRTIVERALASTHEGNLTWVVNESPDANGNALQFKAQKRQTTLTLFGRLRGFSYKMCVAREVEGHPVSGDHIKITNQKSAEGIPFDLLFRAVRDQVHQNELEAEDHAASVFLARILESIESGIPMGEEDQESLARTIRDEDWNILIERLTSATKQGDVQWEGDEDAAEGASYRTERGGLSYVLEKEPNPDHGYTLWIDDGEWDLGNTRQWDDSSLERLAETVGIHTRKTEAQFAAIAKAADLEAMLEDITADS